MSWPAFSPRGLCVGLALLGGTSCELSTSSLNPSSDSGQVSDPASAEARAVVCESSDCGPSYENFFDESNVADLHIRFDPATLAEHKTAAEDWATLMWSKWYHCGPYTNYLPVTVTYDPGQGITPTSLEKVGIRFRGGKGKGDKRPGFKLAFHKLLDKPAEGQKKRRFADLNRLNLLSLERDESVMVQCMGYKLMREFGLPAPMCNHLRVYVNGEYYGLMENVEEPDDGRFLTRHFGQNKGALFEASHGCGFRDHLADLEYKGPKFKDGYHKAYDLVRGDPTQDQPKLMDMIHCADDTTTPDDEAFRACIKNWIDVPVWLKTIAAESITPMLESFTGARRNYYLYFVKDPQAEHGGRFQIYSWDYDHTLHRVKCSPENCDLLTAIPSWWAPNGQRSRLTTRLTSVFRDEYCQYLAEFRDHVYLESQIDEMADAIRPAMKKDPDIGAEEWADEVLEMRNHLRSRRVQVTEMMTNICK